MFTAKFSFKLSTFNLANEYLFIGWFLLKKDSPLVGSVIKEFLSIVCVGLNSASPSLSSVNLAIGTLEPSNKDVRVSELSSVHPYVSDRAAILIVDIFTGDSCTVSV